MRLFNFLLLFILLITGFSTEAQDPALNTRFDPAGVSKIKLQPTDKKSRAISFTSKLNLLVLLSPECPLCKNYSVTLNKIQKEFVEDLNIYGIVPGKAYSTKDIGQYVREYKISFPIYIDAYKELTTYIRGTVTPEVVLLNKTGDVIYRGAIDDWVSELGKKKLAVSNEYLKTAITQYLQNGTVSIKIVEPKGCLINEF